MADQSDVKVQSVTRVHMVPRVNQGQTIALAFELPGAPTVAYGTPVQAFKQLFVMIPKVLSDAKRLRAEAGLIDAVDQPAVTPTLWEVDSLESTLSEDGKLNLCVNMDGCSVHLQLRPELIQHLGQLLGVFSSEKVDPKKANKFKTEDAVKKVLETSSKMAQSTVSVTTAPKKSTKAASKVSVTAPTKKVAAKALPKVTPKVTPKAIGKVTPKTTAKTATKAVAKSKSTKK